MNYRFENGEIVTWDTEKYGRGKGFIVGYVEKTGEYIVYPNNQHDWTDYPFTCLVISSENLMSTPF